MKGVALVTGASHGIGKSIARSLAGQGYDLGICCRQSGESLDSLKEELQNTYSIRVLAEVGDVGDPSFVSDFVKRVRDELGTVTVLVNNAGISYIGLLSDMTVEEWERVLRTNLSSCFYTCKEVIPGMVQRKAGKILNISSVWGNVGASCEVAYSAAKGGMNAFTKALAKELAPSNIQVNAIACGAIDTRMNQCFSEEERQSLCEEIPAGRFGEPEEIGELVVNLVTGNDYLTGQIITVDGGWT